MTVRGKGKGQPGDERRAAESIALAGEVAHEQIHAERSDDEGRQERQVVAEDRVARDGIGR